MKNKFICLLTGLYGNALIIIGAAGILLSTTKSVTALIPAFIGLIITIGAVLATLERHFKTVMHLVSGLALIAFAGTATALPDLLAGGDDLKTVTKGLTALLSLGYLIFAVRYFIKARRVRHTKTYNTQGKN